MKKTFITLALVFIANVMFSQTLSDFKTCIKTNNTYAEVNTFGFYNNFSPFNPSGVVYNKSLSYNERRQCYFTSLTIKNKEKGDIKILYCFKNNSNLKGQKCFRTVIITETTYAYLFDKTYTIKPLGNKMIIEK